MNNSTPYTPEDIIKMLDFPYQTRNRVNEMIYIVDKINLKKENRDKIFEKSCEKKISPLCIYLIKYMSNDEKEKAISHMINKNCPVDFSIKGHLSESKINELLKVATSLKNHKNINVLNQALNHLNLTMQPQPIDLKNTQVNQLGKISGFINKPS